MDYRKVERYQSGLIDEVLAIAPGLQQVFAIAASPQPRENHWVAYEALKRMSRQYIGENERGWKEGIEHRHYAAIMQHIEELLPPENIKTEYEEMLERERQEEQEYV
jgi:hypothetical protein